MKVKKRRFYLLSLMLVVSAALMYSTLNTKAAELGRGRAKIDLAKMVLRDSSTTSDKSGLRAEDSTSYTLFYKNRLGDMNNIGIEYYYGEKLDLTDVTRVEWSGERKFAGDCKAYLYFNPYTSSNKCRVDDKDMTTATFSEYGGDWFDVGSFGYKKYETKGFDVMPQYSKYYLHMGLVHEWGVHETTLKISNAGTNTMNIKYKERKAGILDVEKIQVVKEDGTTEIVKPLTNLKLSLNDGNSYGVGSTGSVYRDEQMVIQYTRSNDYDFDIVGFNFYSDTSKNTLLYTRNISGGDNQTTIIMDVPLIQALEKNLGPQKLNEFYIEPIIKQKDVTFEIVEDVPVVSDVAAKKSSDGKSIVITDTTLNQTIGTIEMNEAAHIGDFFRMKYRANASYSGDYKYSYTEVRECSSSVNVSTTNSVIVKANDNADVVDYNKKLTQNYCWLNVHVEMQAQLTLKDKTVTYNNQQVAIDPASVSWAEGYDAPVNVNNITYSYYTDEACTEKMDSNERPINAGVYYVKASMSGDSLYRSTTSNVARLEIQKAMPTIESLISDKISYGQKLEESKIQSGKVTGISGNDMTSLGTFEWVEPELVLNAGKQMAKVRFVLTDSMMKQNYADAEEEVMVQIDLQKPVVDIKDAKIPYTGEEIVFTDTTVTDAYTGESTGQTIYYYYFQDLDGDGEIESDEYVSSIKELGIYRVEAEVYEEDGNYGTSMDAATIEIIERISDILIIPMKENNEIQFIFTNTASYNPKGSLSISVDGEKIEESLSLEKSDKGYYYASYPYDSIVEMTGDSESVTVSAHYEAENESYFIVNDTNLNFQKSTNYGAKIEIIDMDYGETIVKTIDEASFDKIKWTKSADGIVQWNYENGQLSITGENTGSTILSGVVSFDDVKQYFVYILNVDKMKPVIHMSSKTVQYTGKDTYLRASNITSGDNDITSKVAVVYEEYVDAECTIPHSGTYHPVNAGTYYIKATIEPTEINYGAEKVATLIIEQIPPTIKMKDATVEFDGEEHQLKAEVMGLRYQEQPGFYITEIVPGKVVYTYEPISESAYLSENGYPVGIGTYKVIATVQAEGNYSEATASAVLTIKQSYVTVQLNCMSSSYGTNDVKEYTVKVINTEGVDIFEYIKNHVSIRYRLTMGDEILTERPTEAGNYYAWAVIEPEVSINPIISEMIEFTVSKSDIQVSIPKVIRKTYDGKAVEVSDVIVTGENNQKDITDDAKITYKYYADSEGTVEIETPVEAGEYYVIAVVEETSNYHGGSSELQKVVISYDDELYAGSFSEDETNEAIRDEESSSEESGAVQTGDENTWILYLDLAAAAMCATICVRIWQKGRKYE